MLKLILAIVFLAIIPSYVVAADETDKVIESVFGARTQDKFSFHRSSYFILGKDDLKIQFSFKYRLAKSIPIYLAHTQMMFWSIYDESKPFRDSTYNPEAFWRLIDKEKNAFSTLDLGYQHLSNGKAQLDSRSFDRLFARTNYYTTLMNNKLNFSLMVYQIYNTEQENKDIVKHIGYWELQVLAMDLIKIDTTSVAFELRTYAGKKVYDIDKGAIQTGLQVFFDSQNFNPSIYLQRFEGYAENLLDYNKKSTQYRLGLHLRY